MYATKWREIGVFNRDTQTYHVERIPKPPEAKVRFEHDHQGRASILSHELKVGCPKCLDQIIVRWDKQYSDLVLNDAGHMGGELGAIALLNEVVEAKRQAEAQARGAQQREMETRDSLKRVMLKLERLKRSKRTKRSKRERKARGAR